MGKGEGGDNRGQAKAGKDRAEGVAAGAEGQGEGQGQRAAERPRADPFNVADVRAGMDMRWREWRSLRESVVADILEVSEDEGEGLVWFGSRPVPDALAHGQHSPVCRHDWARRIAVLRSQGLPDC